ncbi:NUDIX hydrolase [Peptoniphilus sp. GNH]|nr:nudix-type nucleoside diphosphatase, YffH/AdpP family [Clostridiales bacterium KA00134]UHR03041.1 NUDIX hydrolase [Peptoniphilus sp. GNH]
MSIREKTMQSNKVFEGKIFSVRVDTVELPNAKYAKREIVEHKGAAAAVCVNNDGKLIFVRQFRKACDEILLEIPAGKLEIGEKPIDCIRREVEEETGYTDGKFEYITEFYTSAGFSNEKIHLFLAHDLKAGQSHPDEDEYVEVEIYSLEEALKMIELGEIMDAKTIIGILYYKNMRSLNGI